MALSLLGRTVLVQSSLWEPIYEGYSVKEAWQLIHRHVRLVNRITTSVLNFMHDSELSVPSSSSSIHRAGNKRNFRANVEEITNIGEAQSKFFVGTRDSYVTYGLSRFVYTGAVPGKASSNNENFYAGVQPSQFSRTRNAKKKYLMTG